MAPLKLLAFLSIPLLALTSPVEDYLALKPRAASSQAASTPTPTGPYCVGSATAKPVTTKEIESAVAGCVGVQAIGTNDTRNDIVDGICKPITLIFARGTGEDPNLGNIVGPPLVDALNATFGTKHVAVQGVNHYPATDIGFCEGGSASGAHNLAYVRTYASGCRLLDGFPLRATCAIPKLLADDNRLRSSSDEQKANVQRPSLS